MTLLLPGVDTLPPPLLRQKALSQWFSPQPLADRIAAWAHARKPLGYVLEPSAGAGALVRAALRHVEPTAIHAVEIDQRYASELSCEHHGILVECCDYLTRAAPPEIYDTALMNPPYEGGLDGRFVAKAMVESRRVVALLRLDALAGKERHERVWSQTGWGIAALAVLVQRPDFGGEHGAMGDYVVVDMERQWVPQAWARLGTCVEWWT